jgi:hypothetical protein
MQQISRAPIRPSLAYVLTWCTQRSRFVATEIIGNPSHFANISGSRCVRVMSRVRTRRTGGSSADRRTDRRGEGGRPDRPATARGLRARGTRTNEEEDGPTKAVWRCSDRRVGQQLDPGGCSSRSLPKGSASGEASRPGPGARATRVSGPDSSIPGGRSRATAAAGVLRARANVVWSPRRDVHRVTDGTRLPDRNAM